MMNTLLCLALLALVLPKKHRLRLSHRLRSKSTGFSTLMPGQIIDDKYALHERLRWFSKESNT